MTHSTSQPPTPAIPLSAEQLAALLGLLPLLGQLAQRLLDFQTQPVTPQASHDLETDLLALTQQIGRAALETPLDSLEGDQGEQFPPELTLGGLRYRRQGLPIGSGVTEAGCKVLVSQRLERSGMAWKNEGGQVVLTLRAVYLSGVWARAWNIYLAETTNMVLHSFNRLLAYRAVGAA
jgi:hypothetical protein